MVTRNGRCAAIAFALISMAPVLPALAQVPEPRFQGQVEDIERCLADTPDHQISCAGRLANDCQMSLEGSTTPGIVFCLRQETELWDRMLNQRYAVVVQRTRERAAEAASFPAARDTDAVAALRDAQRKWLAFRDAECDRLFQYNIAGTIRGPVFASCMLHRTAERAIDFDLRTHR